MHRPSILVFFGLIEKISGSLINLLGGSKYNECYCPTRIKVLPTLFCINLFRVDGNMIY